MKEQKDRFNWLSKASLVISIIAVFVSIVAFPYYIGTVAGDVASNTHRLDIQRSDINTVQTRVSSMEVCMKGIETDVAWMRKAVEEIKKMEEREYKMTQDTHKMIKKKVQ